MTVDPKLRDDMNDVPEVLRSCTESEIATFGNYAWSLMDRGLIAGWESGTGTEGEAWADLLDSDRRVVWRLVRSGNWFILMDGRGRVRSASRRLQDALTALP